MLENAWTLRYIFYKHENISNENITVDIRDLVPISADYMLMFVLNEKQIVKTEDASMPKSHKDNDIIIQLWSKLYKVKVFCAVSNVLKLILWMI